MAETSRTRLRRASRVLWLTAGDTVVALAPTAAEPAVIRGPGAELWETFAEAIPCEEAVRRLSAAYGLAADDIRDDVETAVDALLRQGLLEVAP